MVTSRCGARHPDPGVQERIAALYERASLPVRGFPDKVVTSYPDYLRAQVENEPMPEAPPSVAFYTVADHRPQPAKTRKFGFRRNTE